MAIDAATRALLSGVVRRENRSLFQYLREVPPWAGRDDVNTVARLRELAAAELEVVEELSRYLQRTGGGPGPLGSFPDFTPFNDQAVHFLLPAVVREQRQLLAELERDRDAVRDPGAALLADRLLELKRRHVPELDDLHTVPHSFTSVNV